MFKIGKAVVGGERTFIIAEAGINHNGKVETAKKLVKAAMEAGADAVKFQSFRADLMCGFDLSESKDVEGITGGTKSSYEMYKALELNEKAHKEIFEYSRKLGFTCFSSVFDPGSVDMLKKLKTPAFKISSGDLNYLPLIKKACATGLPVLVSNGMATFSETVLCYERLSRLSKNFALLHCVSEYPPKPEDVNLLTIPMMLDAFDCPIGFSDHSTGINLSLAAVALGASIIEKHFTLDNDMEGPDQKLSVNPENFAAMVQGIREIEKALGSHFKSPTKAEWKGRHDGRRGIKAARDLIKGQKADEKSFKLTKPAEGLSPEHLEQILGKKLAKNVSKDTPVSFDMFEKI